MTTPQPYQPRVRINVSTSVKGVKTWDATVEYYDCPVMIDAQVRAGGELVLLPQSGPWNDFALAESDRLVAELDRRYPKEA